MSGVSTVHVALKSLITTTLTGYSRINAYQLQNNPDLMLDKGYGISYGPGTNTNRQVGCHLSVSRAFLVLLTKQVTTMEYDEDGMTELEKSLLEDSILLVKAIEDNPTLATSAGQDGPAMSAIWESDEGIEFLEGKSGSYLLCQMTFNIEYMEALG